MDLATLGGLLAATAVIVAAVFLGGSEKTFIDVTSLVIVVGGTAATTLTQVTLKQFFGSFKVAMRAFFHKSIDSRKLIDEAVELANIARKEGVLALENAEISDPFLKKGISFCIDGHAPAVVQKMLSKDINLTIDRHDMGSKIFKAMGDSAPAMGMIGTLIGLVQMLSAMDDPKKIGPAMAVALLTTLYGAVIASTIALPLSEKLKLISKQEKLNKNLILESVSSIQAGTNPRVLEQLLMTFLPESQRGVRNKDKDAE